DIKCQNVGSQVRGSHNAVNIIGIQPSKSGEMNHGDDHGSGSSDDHDGSNQHPSGNPPGNPNNPNNPSVPSHPSLPSLPGNNNQQGGHSPGNNNQQQGNGKPQTSALQNGVPSGNPAIGAGI
ncbi:MAG TPA: hypothetical protein VH500_10485, partial [Nitrososphaeraceae archaeon]